jgi:transposase
MRARGKRRKYDREFKLEAVRLATKGDRSAAEVARDLGIHPNLIYNWKERLAEDQDQAFPGSGRLKPEAEEMRRLKRQLADIQEERNILKKALAIFSRTPR